MKINRKLFVRSLYIFLIYFGIYFPFDFFLLNEGKDWFYSLIPALINALVFALFFGYFLGGRNQISYKLSTYDDLMKQLDIMGLEFVKTKGDNHYYKIKNNKWPNRRVVIRKTAFYLHVGVPNKDLNRFLELRDNLEKVEKGHGKS